MQYLDDILKFVLESLCIVVDMPASVYQITHTSQIRC